MLDPEHLLNDPLKELNISKIQSPLVVVDPVDKTRNGATVVSRERYALLVKAAKAFLKHPSEKYFVLKKEKIPNRAITLEVTIRKKNDIIAGKLYAIFMKLKKQIALNRFTIKKSGFIFEKKSIFWFALKSITLPQHIEVKGPPLNLHEHVSHFKKKHKKTITKKGHIYASELRKYTHAKVFLKNFINSHKKEFSRIAINTKVR